mmetsp:Transcript_25640/g.60417  ORF Transcript_25640/g.60417 Transcript_25640/m.60417 type:complete len:234 (+) Transcript_25640:754-1455(+)
MIMLATERSSDIFSSALLFEEVSFALRGGGGAVGSNTLCSALGSLGAMGKTSVTGFSSFGFVVDDEMALSRSCSSDAMTRSASTLACSSSFISLVKDSCRCVNSLFWFLSFTRSVSIRRNFATKTDSRSFPWSSFRPAISGSLSGISGSSALYSKRFKIRSSRFMLSTKDLDGAASSCSAVWDNSEFSRSFCSSSASILDCRARLSSTMALSLTLISSLRALTVWDNSATSAS